MEPAKPLKRHAAIVEFSRDHHLGLLLVWKIKEGLKKSIEPSRISNYIIHFFNNDLVHHFKEEEELLFPALPADNSLRIQAESEHRKIYELIGAMQKEPENIDILQVFAETLEKHIRFEERELFNYMQKNITEYVLLKIASSVKPRDHACDITWTDTFWEKVA